MERPPIDQQITFLYTHDLTVSSDFYERVLGLTLWLDQGTCRIYQVCDEAFVGICQTGEGEAQEVTRQTNVIFTLVSDDVDGWYEYLKGEGVIFEKAPSVNEKYHIYHCMFRDPNGYLIEIQRFLH